MSAAIDYFFAPQSPWAYLGHERFVRLAQAARATVRVRPMDLGQVFPVSGGLPLGQRAAQRQAYRLVELRRISRYLGLPLNVQPKYFPVAGDDAARLIVAVDRHDGTDAALRLAGAVLTAVWAQERNIADVAVLAQLLAEQGLDAQRLQDARDPEVQQHYGAHTRAAIDAGVFGAPSYVVGGEIFWGQDRLDFLERKLNHTDKETSMGEFIDLKAADGTVFPAYIAKPAGTPKAAVVVLQEIFGVNSHIRSVADGYAAQGYLAVAPSTFHRVKPQVELGYEEQDMNAGFALKTAVEALPAPGVMQDIQAAIDHAVQQKAGSGKVGIVGFCWGGLLTWRAACTLKGLSAAVPYYGGGMTTPDEAGRVPQVPVLAHFGDQDHWIPLESVEAFKRAHPDLPVHIYAANHGFNCDQRGSYDAAAAQQARERTLAFFAQHLA